MPVSTQVLSALLDVLDRNVLEEEREADKEGKGDQGDGIDRGALIAAVREAVSKGQVLVVPEEESGKEKDKESADKAKEEKPVDLLAEKQGQVRKEEELIREAVSEMKEAAHNLKLRASEEEKLVFESLINDRKERENPLKSIDSEQEKSSIRQRIKEKQNTIQLKPIIDDTPATKPSDKHPPPKNQLSTAESESNENLGNDLDWRSLLISRFPPKHDIRVWVNYGSKVCSQILVEYKKFKTCKTYYDLQEEILNSELASIRELPNFARAYFTQLIIKNDIPEWQAVTLTDPIDITELTSGEVIFNIEAHSHQTFDSKARTGALRQGAQVEDASNLKRINLTLLPSELSHFKRQHLPQAEKIEVDPPVELLRVLILNKQKLSKGFIKAENSARGSPTFKPVECYDVSIAVSHLSFKNVWGSIQFNKLVKLTEVDIDQLEDSVKLQGTEVCVVDPYFAKYGAKIVVKACWKTVPSWYPFNKPTPYLQTPTKPTWTDRQRFQLTTPSTRATGSIISPDIHF